MVESIVGAEKLANLLRFLGTAPDGDVVEVGVYFGGSLYRMASRFPDRRFFGYDTFAGLPAPTRKDNHHRAGEFVAAFAQVEPAFSDLPNVTLIAGRFPRTCRLDGYAVALAHVDVDLYESTKESIEHLETQMLKGGRIYCDDANVATCEGATLAVQEYAAEHGKQVMIDPGNHAYLQF